METTLVSNEPAVPLQEIVVRECRGAEDMQSCVELQQRAWGFSDAECVPRRLFVVARKIGGQVIGAWSGETLAGFLMALPALRRTAESNQERVFLHSHMLAVDEHFRNRGLGRRLKLAQRDDALARGVRWIEWTFDPLHPLNAHFNIAGLGAVARRYLPNHYGHSSSRLQAGVPTDRLVAEWWLQSPAVTAAANGEPVAAPSDGDVVERIQLPAELAAWRKQGAAGAQAIRDAQARIRDAFIAAFARGLVVTGFNRNAAGGEYLFSQGHSE